MAEYTPELAEEMREYWLAQEGYTLKAHNYASQQVALWGLRCVVVSRPRLELVPPLEEEPEQMQYADPVTRIHDLDRTWRDEL